MKERTENLIKDFIKEHADCKALESSFRRSVELCLSSVRNGGVIYTCGNGGSAADSEHLSGELLKSFVLKRKLTNKDLPKLDSICKDEANMIRDNLQKGVRCIPLVSLLSFSTAFLNDCSPEYLYAQGVYALGKKDDVLIAISTSGNSKNVVNAAKVALALDMKVISLTGQGGGKLASLSTVLLDAPTNVTFKVQEYHLPFYHLVALCIESELFL